MHAGVGLDEEKSVLMPARVICCWGYFMDSATGVFLVAQECPLAGAPDVRAEAFRFGGRQCLRTCRFSSHTAGMDVVVGRLGCLFMRAASREPPISARWMVRKGVPVPEAQKELRFGMQEAHQPYSTFTGGQFAGH